MGPMRMLNFHKVKFFRPPLKSRVKGWGSCIQPPQDFNLYFLTSPHFPRLRGEDVLPQGGGAKSLQGGSMSWLGTVSRSMVSPSKTCPSYNCKSLFHRQSHGVLRRRQSLDGVAVSSCTVKHHCFSLEPKCPGETFW